MPDEVRHRDVRRGNARKHQTNATRQCRGLGAPHRTKVRAHGGLVTGYFHRDQFQPDERHIRDHGLLEFTQHIQRVDARAQLLIDIQYDSLKNITTGVKETKFGIDIERTLKIYDKYAGNGVVDMSVIHVHLGSGGKTIDPYVNYVKKVLPLVEELRSKGHIIDKLDLGGGYGADYETATVPSAIDYAQGIVPLLKAAKLKLILEPGKSIIANAAIMLARTVFKKSSGKKNFVIVDAGMNDLIRPCLYEAFHFIWPVKVSENFVPEKRVHDLEMDNTEVVDVVGPICEGTDYFAKNRALPPVNRGDLMAVFSVGAYGYTMASNYNARPMCPEVLVDGDQFRIIRKRQTYDNLIELERIP